ncbi:MAG: hypothetical protein QF921_08460 [Pseudomonadales bacterium]|nr:hypothetical protein [Pseudomonadales bacterium]
MGFYPASTADFPSSAYATHDMRNRQRVLDYDDGTGTATETAYFSGFLQDYGGGGLTVVVYWSAPTATSGAVVWKGSFERGNTDMDSDSFDTGNEQTTTTTTSGTAGIRVTSTISFSNSQIDGITGTNQIFRFQLQRDTGAAGDTLTGDAEVYGVAIYES